MKLQQVIVYLCLKQSLKLLWPKDINRLERSAQTNVPNWLCVWQRETCWGDVHLTSFSHLSPSVPGVWLNRCSCCSRPASWNLWWKFPVIEVIDVNDSNDNQSCQFTFTHTVIEMETMLTSYCSFCFPAGMPVASWILTLITDTWGEIEWEVQKHSRKFDFMDVHSWEYILYG